MRFSTVFCAVGAFAVAVFAQQNPISEPTQATEIIAGKPCMIKWNPTSEGTISLYLRQGDSKNLGTVGPIAEGVENSGVYEWVPEKELPGGDDYAIQIVSEDDEINYTSLLSIKSDVKAKPVSESASPSASASEEAPKSTHHDASKTMTTDAPHHTTMASNGTIVTSTKPYSNSTATSTKKSSSARPSSTSSAEESSVPSTPADSGAIGVVRSPLALVACLVGAIVYFN